jgi:hypothetical protein
VYGIPLNHESKAEDFLFFVFQSVSQVSAVNMNAPPLQVGLPPTKIWKEVISSLLRDIDGDNDE